MLKKTKCCICYAYNRLSELRLLQLKRTLNLPYKALLQCVILSEILELKLKQPKKLPSQILKKFF